MMKVKISAEKLKELLKNAGVGIGNRTSLPILSGVLLEAKGGELIVSSTDLELSIKTYAECEVIEEGTCVVEYKRFKDIINKQKDDITLAQNEEEIVIKSGKAKFNLRTRSAKEYPKLPIVEGESFAIPSDIFKDMVRKTSFAVSTDEVRPVLTGVKIELTENKCKMIALDGYRLAYVEVENEEIFIDEEKELIIPGKSIKNIANMLDEDIVVISTDDNFAMFTFGNTTISARLLDGQFINYKDILFKQKTDKVVKVNTDTFKDNLDQAALMGSLIKLNIEKDEIKISSNDEIGVANLFLNCELEGEGLEIAFNPKFLKEGINVIDTEEIKLNLSNPQAPCIIEGVSSEQKFKYLVLPVRLI